MKSCISTILLLAALVVAGRLSAVVAEDVETIRLPSDSTGLADQEMATAPTEARKNGNEERPWKCCDLSLCTRSYPPICQCQDKVEQCAAACKRCEEAPSSSSDSSGYACADWYHGFPGPRCTEE